MSSVGKTGKPVVARGPVMTRFCEYLETVRTSPDPETWLLNVKSCYFRGVVNDAMREIADDTTAYSELDDEEAGMWKRIIERSDVPEVAQFAKRGSNAAVSAPESVSVVSVH